MSEPLLEKPNFQVEGSEVRFSNTNDVPQESLDVPQENKEASTKYIKVDETRLKKNISTYYSRCFKISGKNPNGSNDQQVRDKNKDKVRKWARELLENFGVESRINLEQKEEITYTHKKELGLFA